MLSGFRFRASRVLLASFVAVTFLPAIALFWLSWRYFDQDRALAMQRLRERREQAADLIVLALQQTLTAAEQRLGQAVESGSPEAVSVEFHDDRVEANPRLLYCPVVRPLKEAAGALFQRGE